MFFVKAGIDFMKKTGRCKRKVYTLENLINRNLKRKVPLFSALICYNIRLKTEGLLECQLINCK